MNFKKILDFKSKTFVGTLLGIVALLIDSSNFYPQPPQIVLTIAEIIGFALAFFGLLDAAEQSKRHIIDKAKDFFTNNIAAGILLEAVSHVIDKIPSMPDVPNGLVYLAQIVGAILIAMGLRQKMVQARANTAPPADVAAVKYRHLLEK